MAELLRPWLAGPVEHIGSTSVPGLRAKPVIDMLAPVGSLAGAQAAVPVLAARPTGARRQRPLVRRPGVHRLATVVAAAGAARGPGDAPARAE